MIVKPTDPNAISSAIGSSQTILTYDAAPTAVGHDSSPLAGLPHVLGAMGMGAGLLPDKFEQRPVLTRQERVAAWTEFWNNLTKTFKRDQPFPVFFTTRGRTTGGPDPVQSGPPVTSTAIRYD
jgi:hypothetical protein